MDADHLILFILTVWPFVITHRDGLAVLWVLLIYYSLDIPGMWYAYGVIVFLTVVSSFMRAIYGRRAV